MAEIIREQVLAALGRVEDPASGQDVVSRGLIQGVVIRGGHVGFAIEVTPEQGPHAEPLRLACETAVKAIPGVTDVTAVLTAEHVPTAGAQTTVPPKPHHPHQPQAAHKPGVAGVAKIIAVASGKGGVGKSTTAVNLAVALSRRGLRVGLMDADIYGPSVPKLLGISAKPRTREDKKILPMQAHGIVAMSIGFMVDPDTAMIWRGPMVMGALQQLLGDVAWDAYGPLDILVVDMPPGTGDAQLTMAQRVPLAGAVIVSTPQDIALIDARKGITMFQKVNVPILGLVENMSSFICPHCGGESQIFGHGGARATAEQFGAPFLGEIPLKLAIRETSDAGAPITASEPDGPEAAAYLALADNLLGQLGGAVPVMPEILFE
ncbi:Mrp/NBP35 family ATP-binding protein [Govanella unica]|uniref:Iron-sulfur cluster carrier protein n=1 Tax=Govanella unica TaxID=2975056 RepID=A0A9X3TWZ4_9PROT|nr:Mrp/NBP35 family ATP-binding protein [Govania unica]MDA5193491.1 Mrp/NBP35 family ATP-binding protein [Govania unica]